MALPNWLRYLMVVTLIVFGLRLWNNVVRRPVHEVSQWLPEKSSSFSERLRSRGLLPPSTQKQQHVGGAAIDPRIGPKTNPLLWFGALRDFGLWRVPPPPHKQQGGSSSHPSMTPAAKIPHRASSSSSSSSKYPEHSSQSGPPPPYENDQLTAAMGPHQNKNHGYHDAAGSRAGAAAKEEQYPIDIFPPTSIKFPEAADNVGVRGVEGLVGPLPDSLIGAVSDAENGGIIRQGSADRRNTKNEQLENEKKDAATAAAENGDGEKNNTKTKSEQLLLQQRKKSEEHARGVYRSFKLGPLLGTLGNTLGWLPKRVIFQPIEAMMLYHPRTYRGYPSVAELDQLLAGFLMSIQTFNYTSVESRAKRQRTGFMLVPRPERKVSKWWIFFGGNGMLALDWVTFASNLNKYGKQRGRLDTTGYLLLDYPGYGGSPGKISPRSVLESSVSAVQELMKTTENGTKIEINLLGHSLGSAAALQLAVALHERAIINVTRLVLSAPFTSIPDIANEIFGVPRNVAKGLLPHLWDNERSQQIDTHTLVQHADEEVASSSPSSSISSSSLPPSLILTIIHGVKDALVPVDMGRKLAAQANEGQNGYRVKIVEIQGADHNDVIDQSKWQVRSAFMEAMFGGDKK
eukprot:jgi/Bigna1/90523/estExt_fgenesh1_pg.C_720074